MPRLVANADLRYASRDLKAGEEFEASESDAFVLTTVGKAVAKAEPEEHADEPSQTKRRYNRRDMRAAD